MLRQEIKKWVKDNFLYYQGYKIKVAWRIETGVEERILSEGEKKKIKN